MRAAGGMLGYISSSLFADLLTKWVALPLLLVMTALGVLLVVGRPLIDGVTHIRSASHRAVVKPREIESRRAYDTPLVGDTLVDHRDDDVDTQQMDPVKERPRKRKSSSERTNESLDAIFDAEIVDETPSASAEESLPRDVPTDDELNKARTTAGLPQGFTVHEHTDLEPPAHERCRPEWNSCNCPGTLPTPCRPRNCCVQVQCRRRVLMPPTLSFPSCQRFSTNLVSMPR
ncbi:cell division protein FtsK [Cutibacterium acnes JCM 18918]|nr:cell division protein FtsK [Cutibacterium acnes JCM 18918]